MGTLHTFKFQLPDHLEDLTGQAMVDLAVLLLSITYPASGGMSPDTFSASLKLIASTMDLVPYEVELMPSSERTWLAGALLMIACDSIERSTLS